MYLFSIIIEVIGCHSEHPLSQSINLSSHHWKESLQKALSSYLHANISPADSAGIRGRSLEGKVLKQKDTFTETINHLLPAQRDYRQHRISISEVLVTMTSMNQSKKSILGKNYERHTESSTTMTSINQKETLFEVHSEDTKSHVCTEKQLNQKESAGLSALSLSESMKFNSKLKIAYPEGLLAHEKTMQSSDNSGIPFSDEPHHEEEQIQFTTGTVEIITGILHLYRDKSETHHHAETTMICLPMVPIHVSLSELLEWIRPTLHMISYMRILR
jgi:predicted transcriptional regulator